MKESCFHPVAYLAAYGVREMAVDQVVDQAAWVVACHQPSSAPFAASIASASASFASSVATSEFEPHRQGSWVLACPSFAAFLVAGVGSNRLVG